MSFGKQKQAFIVHITESTVQLLLREMGLLTLLRVLPNNESSAPEYAKALSEHPTHPVILFADLIDESFRHDTIIHVSGSDRAALIKRKLDFAFRNTPYRIGRVTGRLDDGRRDDKLLMSAINKPDAINPWIKTLVAEKRAVQTLTSVAYLLRLYVALEKLNNEEFLLISNLEDNNSLRQSFFKKGQLLFSRLTTISNRNEITLGSDIYLETLQVRQYLERIQFITFETPLRIQLFSSYDEAILQLEAKSSDINNFEVINASALLNDMKVELNGQPGSPALYQLARVLSVKKPENVYAQPQITRYHELNSFAAGLNLSAAIILGTGLMFQLPLVQRIRDQWEQRDTFQTRTIPLQRQYDSLSQNFPQSDVSPAEMALMVESYDTVNSQTHNPIDAMNAAAEALSRSPGLVLTSLEWSMKEAPLVPVDDGFGNFQLPQQEDPVRGTVFAGTILSALLRNQTEVELIIHGEAYSPDSYREAQDQVNVMVEALRSHEGVKVFAEQMPTDVRTDIDMTTRVDDGEVRAPFTLEVTFSEPTDSSNVTAGGNP